MSNKIITPNEWSRRGVLKAGLGTAAIAGAPMFYMKNAYAAGYLNDPGSASSVSLVSMCRKLVHTLTKAQMSCVLISSPLSTSTAKVTAAC